MKARALGPTALVTTQQPIIERLNKDLRKLLSSEDLKQLTERAAGPPLNSCQLGTL